MKAFLRLAELNMKFVRASRAYGAAIKTGDWVLREDTKFAMDY